jgi:hypothetical protein
MSPPLDAGSPVLDRPEEGLEVAPDDERIELTRVSPE